MKKVLILLLSVAIALSYSFSAVEVEAATQKATKATTYANCTALNKVYKGGVAKSASVKNKGGKTKYKPFVSEAIYNANKKSDRDNDFIACER